MADTYGETSYRMDLFKDSGKTGNFEVHLFKQDYTSLDQGALIHSKQSTGSFPTEDPESFFETLEAKFE